MDNAAVSQLQHPYFPPKHKSDIYIYGIWQLRLSRATYICLILYATEHFRVKGYELRSVVRSVVQCLNH